MLALWQKFLKHTNALFISLNRFGIGSVFGSLLFRFSACVTSAISSFVTMKKKVQVTIFTGCEKITAGYVQLKTKICNYIKKK